jgi:hypothetical protein
MVALGRWRGLAATLGMALWSLTMQSKKVRVGHRALLLTLSRDNYNISTLVHRTMLRCLQGLWGGEGSKNHLRLIVCKATTEKSRNHRDGTAHHPKCLRKVKYADDADIRRQECPWKRKWLAGRGFLFFWLKEFFWSPSSKPVGSSGCLDWRCLSITPVAGRLYSPGVYSLQNTILGCYPQFFFCRWKTQSVVSLRKKGLFKGERWNVSVESDTWEPLKGLGQDNGRCCSGGLSSCHGLSLC